MPYIVQQCSQKCDTLVVRIGFAIQLRDHISQSTCHVIYTNTVSKAAVGCPREDKIREAQLADAAQSLKLGHTKQLPYDPIRFDPVEVCAATEHNQPVNRIADTLCSLIALRHHDRLVDRRVNSHCKPSSNSDKNWHYGSPTFCPFDYHHSMKKTLHSHRERSTLHATQQSNTPSWENAFPGQVNRTEIGENQMACASLR